VFLLLLLFFKDLLYNLSYVINIGLDILNQLFIT